ncbi:hypothetical protein H7F36_09925 [Variovorax sp. PAMC28562]|uniref:hypothetical protein n=1 Tax=Variovorax sp. PAMC28562 TaxID=2762323 RepID=UPI00164D8498|nr:hypothetical protein [Variovorax sp. PAMC28562]QNK75472.1 hypothetical protein H7F36_09925 [Variovorax sp. PAMC28562]
MKAKKRAIPLDKPACWSDLLAVSSKTTTAFHALLFVKHRGTGFAGPLVLPPVRG